MHSKLVLLKCAWCDSYDGDPVRGDFGYLREHGENSGHEKFNFHRAPDGWFYGYCPPVAGSAPKPKDSVGWTIVWVAKKPETTGVRVVGIYFDAEMPGAYLPHVNEATGEEVYYCARAKRGLFVPEPYRRWVFKSPIRSGACLYARGGTHDRKYAALAKRLDGIVADVVASAPAFELAAVHVGYADAAHRKRVEKASVEFAKAHLRGLGYEDVKDVQRDNLGYDLVAIKGRRRVHVEVKGTSGTEAYAFMTAREFGQMKSLQPATWRLYLVTCALDKPALNAMSGADVENSFDIDPIAYKLTKKRKAGDLA